MEEIINKMVDYLMPWYDKTDGAEMLGDWEQTLPEKMMEKLLELWLSEESRKQLQSMLSFYHPLDRATLAYALLVFLLTGHKMEFKHKAAQQHFDIMCESIEKENVRLKIENYGNKNLQNRCTNGSRDCAVEEAGGR